MGSVPHPDQKLTGIHTAEGRGGSVVGPEVIEQTVLLCGIGGINPPDLPVVVSEFEEVFREGHRVGVGCFGILQDRGGTRQEPRRGHPR